MKRPAKSRARFRLGAAALTLLLTAALSLSAATTAFAADNGKVMFMNALRVTGNELKKEYDLSNKGTLDANKMVENLLLKLPNEISVQSDITVSGVGDKDMIIKFLESVKNDVTSGKGITSVDMQYPDYVGDRSINLNVYHDADKIAFNAPDLSDQYYIFDEGMTADEWNASEIGKLKPVTGEEFAYIEQIFSAISTQSQSVASAGKLMPKLKPELGKPYKALLLGLIGGGAYQDGGVKTLSLPNGEQSLRDLSVTIKQKDIDKFFQDLAAQIRTDKNIRELLDAVYGSMSKATGTDLTQTVITAAADALESVAFPSDVTYHIYTDKSGLVQCHQLVFEALGMDCSVYLSTSGKPYLLNDINLTFSAADAATGDSALFVLHNAGDMVPKDGVSAGRTDAYAKVTSPDSNGMPSTQHYDLFHMTYSLNANASRDNVKLEMHAGQFNPPYDFYRPYDFNMTASGDYAVDTVSKTMDLNLKKIDITFLKDYSVSMNLRVGFQPVDAAQLELPADKTVNILDLTPDQAKAVLDYIDNLTSSQSTNLSLS